MEKAWGGAVFPWMRLSCEDCILADEHRHHLDAYNHDDWGGWADKVPIREPQAEQSHFPLRSAPGNSATVDRVISWNKQ